MAAPDGGGPARGPVALPGGRSLRVRPVTPSDASGLAALFDGLSGDDLYRRFFQAHPPPAHVVTAMTVPSADAGVGLVAELRDAAGTRRIVAEAAYALLPDGDGELAITVAGGWRGWLGPYLLDTLMAEAARRGVHNLQADVLCENRNMMAVIRSRGYATMGHSLAPAIVRVVMSTTGRVPGWPTTQDRPRLVVEASGAHWRAEDAARAAGMAVLVCPGPASPRLRCPAMAGRPCPLVAGADVVVDAVDPASEVGASLLRAHGALHDTPVHVDAPVRTLHRRRTPRPAADGTGPTTGTDTMVGHLLRLASATRRRRASGPSHGSAVGAAAQAADTR